MSESLSNKIASILNAAPASFDPEDDINVETTARVESNIGEGFSDDDEDVSYGNFRKKNVNLLEDVDKRYKGKTATRKQTDEWEFEEEESLDETSNEESVANEMEESSKSEDEISYSDNDSVVSDSINIANEESFKHLQKNSLNEITKGVCIRQQLNMWESMLEIRIQLQKCLLTANKLPETSIFQKLKSTCDKEFSCKVVETKKSVTNLLDKFLNLQLLLLKRYPETKNILDGNNTTSTGSDEEIASDSEDEEYQQSPENLSEEVPSKKMKLNDYESEINKRFSSYKNYQNLVIEKWNNKTRLVNNKPGNVVNSVTNQIEHILSNKEKLIKRTQLKRTGYEIVGQTNQRNQSDDNTEEYNSEIFDDTDFYHHLLRELIEYKSADLTDPVQLGRQWIQLQNLRSKMKRKIDTKATKGRKIRYAVHSKLVNFMAPIDDCMWEKEAESELYNSLFGKTQVANAL